MTRRIEASDEVPQQSRITRTSRRLQCDEADDFCSFRIGLFGLDKLHNVDRSVANLDMTLAVIGDRSQISEQVAPFVESDEE